jgi:hypothetical protein
VGARCPRRPGCFWPRLFDRRWRRAEQFERWSCGQRLRASRQRQHERRYWHGLAWRRRDRDRRNRKCDRRLDQHGRFDCYGRYGFHGRLRTDGWHHLGGGNSVGMDTPPVRPLNINMAAAANKQITFTAKQLDPMAGTSTPDTNATAQEHGFVDTRKPKIQGKLVMTLGGIGTCCGQGGIGGFAVGLGFHEMAIAMQTKESSAPDEYKKVPEASRTDEQNRQMGDARMEAWDGKDRVSWLNINEHDSFAYRAALGIKYMQEQDPGGDWEYFLNADGTVRWSDVYLVGYSYGSQTLAVVAKYVRIGRGIATSGPVDEGFPNATWIKATSATPLDRMIALIGSSNIDSKVTTTTSAGWLVPTVTVKAGATTADLMGGHVFILEGQGHSEMCAGDGGNWKALCQYAFGVAQ